MILNFFPPEDDCWVESFRLRGATGELLFEFVVEVLVLYQYYKKNIHDDTITLTVELELLLTACWPDRVEAPLSGTANATAGGGFIKGWFGELYDEAVCGIP